MLRGSAFCHFDVFLIQSSCLSEQATYLVDLNVGITIRDIMNNVPDHREFV